MPLTPCTIGEIWPSATAAPVFWGCHPNARTSCVMKCTRGFQASAWADSERCRGATSVVRGCFSSQRPTPYSLLPRRRKSNSLLPRRTNSNSLLPTGLTSNSQLPRANIPGLIVLPKGGSSGSKANSQRSRGPECLFPTPKLPALRQLPNSLNPNAKSPTPYTLRELFSPSSPRPGRPVLHTQAQ